MNARLSFDDLLEEEGDQEPVTPGPPPGPARDLRSKNKGESGSSEVPDSGSASRPKKRRKKKAPQAPTGPKWASLERKDALLWPEQVAGLTELRRDLQRRRRAAGGGGERITENTLIRVAVSVLLEHGDALAGVDEEQLRESLTAELRDS